MVVGPINAFNGFPVWYKDLNNIRLQLNFDPSDPFSGITPADLPDPTQPVSFPDNYPSEAFYYAAEAEMETGTGGRALLVLALEATFINEIPAEGEQIVFGRVRIRVDGLRPNEEYIVTHPYGVDTFIAEEAEPGVGEINFTEDIGGFNGGDFQLALNSRVFPFLQWDTSIDPTPPEGYIGDPNVLHPVIGSEIIDRFGEPQNIFRIEGPGIGVGSADRSTTPGLNPDNCIETRNFALMGRLSTISGVDVIRTTYTQTDSIGGLLDIFATSDITPQQIEVTGPGITPTLLQGEHGLYFGRVSYEGGQPPSIITVSNVSDNPISMKESVPVDFITAQANYNTDTQIMTVEASSSDSVNPILLTLLNFGIDEHTLPTNGIFDLNLVNVPATITIQSSAGGERVIPVSVTGSPDSPIPVSANAGQDETVIVNTQYTLNGTFSTGPIIAYNWSQIAGTPIILLNSNTAKPSFTAPSNRTTLTFELTVTGEGGPSSDTINIEVIDSVPAPIAHAGPNQTVQQGTLITLAGSSTGLVSTYRWEQVSGVPVQLTNPNSPIATFTFPKQFTSLLFELTVSGPGGTSSDTTEISSIPDNLTVTRAEFRTRDSEWRITGTSDVPGPGVTITIYNGNTIGSPSLSQVEVDPLGNWGYRVEPATNQPDETRAISIESSSGGTLINIPLNVRQ